MMPHTYKNIEKETGMIPYATWNLEGDHSKEILNLMVGVGVVVNTLKPIRDTSIIVDTDKKEPYGTSVSLATKSNKNINRDAEIAFRLISEYVESNPKLLNTILYGYAEKMRGRISKKKESLVDKL